ncbi:ArsR/SmtB family transcription factor [Nocardia salmonicida]|uniref:ArsR/SmtB family transcription factor n=1 Tax=Nocardia salmonicida TaxID=53431 RepID=UPI00386BF818
MADADATEPRGLRALADPTRCAIVERLARGPASVSDLAAPFDAALPTIVQHLKALEAGRLVSSAKIGARAHLPTGAGAFGTAMDWLHRNGRRSVRWTGSRHCSWKRPQPQKEKNNDRHGDPLHQPRPVHHRT